MQVLMDTMDVRIFDENEKLVATFDWNQQAYLSLDATTRGLSYFAMKSAVLNLDFLKSMGDKADESDFQMAAKGKTTIKFKQNSLKNKFYKIVANGVLYDHELSTVSHNFDLVIHKAKLDKDVDINAEHETFTPSYVFRLEEDMQGNFVDLQLQEING